MCIWAFIFLIDILLLTCSFPLRQRAAKYLLSGPLQKGPLQKGPNSKYFAAIGSLSQLLSSAIVTQKQP